MLFFFFFKQKTAYEMRISDWSSDVCSSDLALDRRARKLDRRDARRARRSFQGARRYGRRSDSNRRARHQMGRQIGRGRGRRMARDSRKNPRRRHIDLRNPEDRNSVVKGKSVSVRVDLGGRRFIKKKKKQAES